MRRLVIAVIMLATVVSVGACDTANAGTIVTPGASAAAGDSTGSKAAVCGRIRSAVAERITSLGTALGKYVGAHAADADGAMEDARSAATKEVKGVASDMSRLGREAVDSDVRQAAASASKAIDAIATDPDFVSDVKSVRDIPTAVSRLNKAAQPLADACR